MIKKRYNMTLMVVQCYWNQLQHHVMPLASSMAPLHFCAQDNQTEVQHDFLGHVIPLTLALTSYDATSIGAM